MYLEFPRKSIVTKSRIGIIIFCTILVFLLLTGRLFYLQVIKGYHFKSMSENNRMRLIRTRTPRGIIYDQNYIPLATNKRVFSIYFDPTSTDEKSNKKSFNHLVKILLEHRAVPGEVLAQQANFSNWFRPKKIIEDLDFATVAAIREQSIDLPGVHVKDELIRYYPLHYATAHLLGYLRNITVDELQRPQYEDYELDDMVGRNGLEQVYERHLRGKAGGWLIEVDAVGRKRRDIDTISPELGNNIILNIDARLQEKAQELLKGQKGSIIAMNPQTGGILAMVSEPAYNSNFLSGFITTSDWLKIINDPGRPLQNRAIMGTYPPGSVFKLIPAIVGLEENKIQPHTTFYCSGAFRLGRWTFRCHEREGHGTLNLISAIAKSCNVYFYHTARLVGIENLFEYAAQFGLGKPTGVDLSNERGGLLPNKTWEKTFRKRGWFPGDIVQLGIGQGPLLVTPLQIANMVSAIANNGILYRPYIVKQIEDNSGQILHQAKPHIIKKIDISPENMDIIHRGMWSAVNSDGTGVLARLPDIEIAGKTGTAQSGTGGPAHAWFGAYAPYENPEIVVLVMVEGGGLGGEIAAPIARELFSLYFQQPRLKPDIEKEQWNFEQIARIPTIE